MKLDEQNIVKIGVCYYAGHVPYRAFIVKRDVRFGSGDYEDPPEIANDIEMDCWWVWFEDMTRHGEVCSGGGVFSSLEEAMANVEKATQVEWD